MTQRSTQISEEYKASIAAMTNKEFQEWFCRYIDFLASRIDPSTLMVSMKIVEVMNRWDEKTLRIALRHQLASELHRTSAYQRLFAEQEDVA